MITEEVAVKLIQRRITEFLFEFSRASDQDRAAMTFIPGYGESVDGITRPGIMLKIAGKQFNFGCGSEIDVIVASIESIVEDQTTHPDIPKQALSEMATYLQAARKLCIERFNDTMKIGESRH